MGMAISAGIQKTMTTAKESKIPSIDEKTADTIAACYFLDGDGPITEEALLTHESSKSLPLMWDKVEVPGPPWPQVWNAAGSFPGRNIEAIDALGVHPVCGRMGLSLNQEEMFNAPYPDPSKWEPGKGNFEWKTFSPVVAWQAMQKGDPAWDASHLLEYCLHPKEILP